MASPELTAWQLLKATMQLVETDQRLAAARCAREYIRKRLSGVELPPIKREAEASRLGRLALRRLRYWFHPSVKKPDVPAYLTVALALEFDVSLGRFWRLQGEERHLSRLDIEYLHQNVLLFYGLLLSIEDEAEERLIEDGMTEDKAAELAHASLVDHPAPNDVINKILRTNKRTQLELHIARATVRGITHAYNSGSDITLPESAPVKWENQHDRLPGETPIEFLRRVWRPWLDAKVLYRDDIAALGDTKLVQAIRGYCHHHKLDVNEHLPPPKKARIEDALAQVPPDSAAAAYYRHRLQVRKAVARHREKAKHLNP